MAEIGSEENTNSIENKEETKNNSQDENGEDEKDLEKHHRHHSRHHHARHHHGRSHHRSSRTKKSKERSLSPRKDSRSPSKGRSRSRDKYRGVSYNDSHRSRHHPPTRRHHGGHRRISPSSSAERRRRYSHRHKPSSRHDRDYNRHRHLSRASPHSSRSSHSANDDPENENKDQPSTAFMNKFNPHNISATLLQTKNERQLYIGNLAPGIDPQQLMEVLNKALIQVGANIDEGGPVINTWMSSDGHYAFAEFRSAEEANRGFMLSTVSIMGYPLKIGRPRVAANTSAPPIGMHPNNPSQREVPMSDTFNRLISEATNETTPGPLLNPQVSEKLHISNLPINFSRDEIVKIFQIFGTITHSELIIDPVTKKFNGEAFVEYTSETDLQRAVIRGMGLKIGSHILETKKVPISQSSTAVALNTLMQNAVNTLAADPTTATNLIGITPGVNTLMDTHPSRVIKLDNMINIPELDDDIYHEEMIDDVTAQCEKYGKVIDIHIPKQSKSSSHTPGLGTIFVQFENIDESIRAKDAIHNMKYGNKMIEAAFFTEEAYSQGLYEAQPYMYNLWNQ